MQRTIELYRPERWRVTYTSCVTLKLHGPVRFGRISFGRIFGVLRGVQDIDILTSYKDRDGLNYPNLEDAILRLGIVADIILMFLSTYQAVSRYPSRFPRLQERYSELGFERGGCCRQTWVSYVGLGRVVRITRFVHSSWLVCINSSVYPTLSILISVNSD